MEDQCVPPWRKGEREKRPKDRNVINKACVAFPTLMLSKQSEHLFPMIAMLIIVQTIWVAPN